MSDAGKRQRRPVLRWILRGLGALFALLPLLAAVVIVLGWQAFGHGPGGKRAQRMAASPNSEDGVFVNTQPMWTDMLGSLTSVGELSEYAEARSKIPVRTDTAERLREPAGPLRVTWLGHSTVLIEMAGKRVLTDPIWGRSPFPLPSMGPQRWYDPPLPLQTLRDVDAVLISHDHYDHLDHPTIEQMVDWDTTFIVPLGVGAHLEYWGIEASRIVEKDWWEEHALGDLRIVCLPARHASGRQVLDLDRTLWAGYALVGPERRVMFSGDTGLFDDMATIGERFGPFDLVMIEVGAYHTAWPDWHIGPEQALIGHRMMKGELFMPIHWGLFNLALHGWTEPVERLLAAAQGQPVTLVTPRPGEVFDVDKPPPVERWWPSIPWQTAAELPIVSTRNGDPDERYR